MLHVLDRLERLARSLAPRNLAEAVLLANNLVPLVGVLVLLWSVQQVLLVYFLELCIVTLLIYAKVILVIARGGEPMSVGSMVISAVFYFCVHFFLAGLALLIVLAIIFHLTVPDMDYSFDYGAALLGFVVAAPYAVASNVISHLTSFWRNFVRKREYQRIGYSAYLQKTLRRLAPTFLVPLVLALPMQYFGFPDARWALVAIVVAKAAFDLWTHRREHWRN